MVQTVAFRDLDSIRFGDSISQLRCCYYGLRVTIGFNTSEKVLHALLIIVLLPVFSVYVEARRCDFSFIGNSRSNASLQSIHAGIAPLPLCCIRLDLDQRVNWSIRLPHRTFYQDCLLCNYTSMMIY